MRNHGEDTFMNQATNMMTTEHTCKISQEEVHCRATSGIKMRREDKPIDMQKQQLCKTAASIAQYVAADEFECVWRRPMCFCAKPRCCLPSDLLCWAPVFLQCFVVFHHIGPCVFAFPRHHQQPPTPSNETPPCFSTRKILGLGRTTSERACVQAPWPNHHQWVQMTIQTQRKSLKPISPQNWQTVPSDRI